MIRMRWCLGLGVLCLVMVLSYGAPSTNLQSKPPDGFLPSGFDEIVVESSLMIRAKSQGAGGRQGRTRLLLVQPTPKPSTTTTTPKP